MAFADSPNTPIFQRSLAPRARLLIMVAICLAMLVADLRFRYLEMLRQGLSVLVYPLQMIAAEPVNMARDARVYFASLAEAQIENANLRQRQLDSGERMLRFEQLERENAELRGLLAMSQRVQTRSLAAEVLYDAPDPFTRKIIIDRGAQQGVEAGLVAVDADGVLGQVTRVYPIQSEITLLTDRNHAIPVQLARNGLRGVLFGTGQGRLELRFVLANADIQPGDRLMTSGLDGIFVPGLPVAEIETIERETDAFARIHCRPIAAVEQSTRVLILGREVLPPPRPESAIEVAPARARPAARAPQRAGRRNRV